MKPIKILFLALAACLFWLSPAKANEISAFHSEITINKDASISIKENIEANVTAGPLHGIYRFIPVNYHAKNGKDFSLPVQNFQVVDAFGQPLPFQKTAQGDYWKFRIGDPNNTFSGKKLFIISYDIAAAINYFDNFDELYWNITGNNWDWPINNPSATVFLPSGLAPEKLQIACYQGPVGSQAGCQSRYNPENNSVSFQGNPVLQPGEGLTVALGFNKGLVEIKERKYAPLASRDTIWLLAALGAIFFAFTIWHFWKNGRDPKDDKPIVAQYEPLPNLTPLDGGAIYNNYHFASASLSGQIIWLAVNGFIRLVKKEKEGFWGTKSANYIFEDLNKDNSSLPEPDRKILGIVAGKSLAYFKGEEAKMFASRAPLRLDIKNLMDVPLEFFKSQGYAQNQRTLGGYFAYIASSAIIIIGFLLLQSETNFPLALFLLLMGIYWLLLNLCYSKQTLLGSQTKNHLKGLKLYLGVAEKDRLEFHNAPEKTPELFDKLLPWATMLGVEKKWQTQFQDIQMPPRPWYVGSNVGDNLALGALMCDISSLSHDLNSGFASGTSASGGGGSAGGGGGGGGGGGW